jgi:hypothetical protein
MPAAQSTTVLLEWVGVDGQGKEYFDADEISVPADGAVERAALEWKKIYGDPWGLTLVKASVLLEE